MDIKSNNKMYDEKLNDFKKSIVSIDKYNKNDRGKALILFFNLFNYEIKEYNIELDNAYYFEQNWFTHYASSQDKDIYIKLNLLNTLYISNRQLNEFKIKFTRVTKTRELNEINVLTNGCIYYFYVYNGTHFELYWELDLNEITDIDYKLILNTLIYGFEHNINFDNKDNSTKLFNLRGMYLLKQEEDRCLKLLKEKEAKKIEIIKNVEELNLNKDAFNLLKMLIHEKDNEEILDIINRIKDIFYIRKFFLYVSSINFNTLKDRLFNCCYRENSFGEFSDEIISSVIHKYLKEFSIEIKGYVCDKLDLIDFDRKSLKKERAKYSPRDRKQIKNSIIKEENDLIEYMESYDCFIEEIINHIGGNIDDYKL